MLGPTLGTCRRFSSKAMEIPTGVELYASPMNLSEILLPLSLCLHHLYCVVARIAPDVKSRFVKRLHGIKVCI